MKKNSERQLTNDKKRVLNKADVMRRFSRVSEYTDDRFIAWYKGHSIYINKIEKRGLDIVFDIEVKDKTGRYAVNTWEEVWTVEEAIAYALTGAELW